MKKLRFLAALILALSLVLPLPVMAASGGEDSCGDGLTWLLEEGTLTIRGQGGMYWYDMGAAPWYPQRLEIRRVVVEEGVTSLSYCAFFYLTELTEASLPQSLRELGSMAFYGCAALEAVELPAGVTSVGRYAFFGCSKLTAITVSPENTVYRDMDGVLFQDTQLLCYPPAREGEEYAVPEGTEKLGECAFSYCGLRRVSIPAGVWLVDPTALTDCHSLEAVEVAWDNWFYTAEGGVLYTYDKSTLLCYPPQRAGASFSVPAEVTGVAIRAFACCDALKRVDILGTLSSLGSLAFEKCGSLRQVVFHGGVPGSVGFMPFPGEVTVYHLQGKPGWENADVSGWNAADLQTWAVGGGLLQNRGRLLK